MKNTNPNTHILADTHHIDGGFDIYLEFSGKREYLIMHRYNPFLYAALKNGVSLEQWRREKAWKPNSGVRNGRMVRQLENAAKHLNAVIDDYLEHREEYLWTQPAHPDPEPQRRTAA